MTELVLMRVSGPDHPGITSALTTVMAQYAVNILDIGQSVTHETLSLGMFLQVPTTAEASAVYKDLLFAAHRLGLTIRFTPVSETDYTHWLEQQRSQRHIVTLLAREITAEHVAAVAAVVAENKLNIEQISRLSEPTVLNCDANAPQRASVEIRIQGSVTDIAELHAQFLQLGQALAIDIAIQEDDIYRRNRKVVCFDMDSTLIQTEVIDELAAVAGIGEQVAAITESAMRGEIDFQQSFRQRMALLKGMDESVLEEIAARLPITEGAEQLITTLKKLGYKVAILSGGFTYFAGFLQRKFGIDYIYANQLDFIDGKLTGEVKGEIIDGARKAELVKEIAAKEGVKLQQVIAVGDGANDLPMLSIAGLGIAFHAKPVVQAQARHCIANMGLDSILYLLGMRDQDMRLLSETH
jgi:phosphoserine phosphatase